MAPCPNTISVRVRMLAPSTVIETGTPVYAEANGLRGPREIALPPRMSMPSLIALRKISVVLYFIMAVTTAGAAPWSSPPFV